VVSVVAVQAAAIRMEMRALLILEVAVAVLLVQHIWVLPADLVS
jgi:hypothetical protein